MKKELKDKRLNIEIPKELHKEIKLRVIFKNVTIRRWVILAMLEQIRREKETE